LNIGHDCKVLSECFAARALWTLGFPDAASRRMEGALAFAKELGHPQSSVGAAHFACELHQLRGDPMLALSQAREVLRLADEYGLEYWVALGQIDLGWANTELGNIQQGIEQIQRGLAAYEAIGGKLWCPRFIGLLAIALMKAERFEEGYAAVERSLRVATLNGEIFAVPELLRIKGELILKDHKPSDFKSLDRKSAANITDLSATERAVACFDEAIILAKQQRTKSWELRALLSKDAIRVKSVNPIPTLLAELYDSFSEGHDTRDLQDARRHLELSGSS
jgi:predicted ATPase